MRMNLDTLSSRTSCSSLAEEIQAERSASDGDTRLYKFVKIAKLEGCSFVELPVELNFAVDDLGAALSINNGEQGT
jgi:hypothetical protein